MIYQTLQFAAAMVEEGHVTQEMADEIADLVLNDEPAGEAAWMPLE